MERLYLFFDESGLNRRQLTLMGGISIPKEIYELTEINDLNHLLREGKVSYHFTNYSKKDFPSYKKLINTFMKYSEYINVNIVAYKLSEHINNKFAGNNEITKIRDDMVYKKLPERVLYGLLRGYGNFTSLKANIYIEHSDQYASRKLDEDIKQILNIHSLYRQENYWVSESKLYPKKKHIGIEFMDTILGMVRLIILNENLLVDRSSRPINNSNTLWYKQSFINKMLKDKVFFNFLSNINYFELNGKNKLSNKNFQSYIRLYQSDFLCKKYHNKVTK